MCNYSPKLFVLNYSGNLFRFFVLRVVNERISNEMYKYCIISKKKKKKEEEEEETVKFEPNSVQTQTNFRRTYESTKLID